MDLIAGDKVADYRARGMCLEVAEFHAIAEQRARALALDVLEVHLTVDPAEEPEEPSFSKSGVRSPLLQGGFAVTGNMSAVNWTPAEFFDFWGAGRDYNECKALSEKLCMSIILVLSSAGHLQVTTSPNDSISEIVDTIATPSLLLYSQRLIRPPISTTAGTDSKLKKMQRGAIPCSPPSKWITSIAAAELRRSSAKSWGRNVHVPTEF